MKIIEKKAFQVEKRTSGMFTGTIDMISLINKDMGSKDLQIINVIFPPGVKSNFHFHDHDQVLYALEGNGFFTTDNEERKVTKGDIVLIPGGEKHSHGATEDSAFSMLNILVADTKTTRIQ
ncbi:MAG: hypothetical protein QG670_1657 [Thermoproteota archaeon]|nr:hypothetical protein [Thermoproteota archaeon]